MIGNAQCECSRNLEISTIFRLDLIRPLKSMNRNKTSWVNRLITFKRTNP